jgi:hypothetical protein
MQHSEESGFLVEYLREYESILETALAHASVEQGYCLTKKPGVEISRDYPFQIK